MIMMRGFRDFVYAVKYCIVMDSVSFDFIWKILHCTCNSLYHIKS